MCIRDREYAVYSTIIRIHTEEEVVETLIQDMDRKTGGAIKLTKCHTLKELCAQLSKMFMSGQIARMHLLIDEVDCFLEAISAADYKMCIRDRVSSDAAGEPALSMGGANGSILQSIFQCHRKSGFEDASDGTGPDVFLEKKEEKEDAPESLPQENVSDPSTQDEREDISCQTDQPAQREIGAKKEKELFFSSNKLKGGTPSASAFRKDIIKLAKINREIRTVLPLLTNLGFLTKEQCFLFGACMDCYEAVSYTHLAAGWCPPLSLRPVWMWTSPRCSGNRPGWILFCRPPDGATGKAGGLWRRVWFTSLRERGNRRSFFLRPLAQERRSCPAMTISPLRMPSTIIFTNCWN